MEFDQKTLKNYLKQKSEVVLRGHLHDAETAQYMTHSGGYLEIAAGALHEGHERPNRFNVIDIDDNLNSLSVKTFLWSQGRWIKDRNLYDNDSGEEAVSYTHLTLPTKA